MVGLFRNEVGVVFEMGGCNPSTNYVFSNPIRCEFGHMVEN